jgi:hypothetical protein
LSVINFGWVQDFVVEKSWKKLLRLRFKYGVTSLGSVWSSKQERKERKSDLIWGCEQ